MRKIDHQSISRSHVGCKIGSSKIIDIANFKINIIFARLLHRIKGVSEEESPENSSCTHSAGSDSGRK